MLLRPSPLLEHLLLDKQGHESSSDSRRTELSVDSQRSRLVVSSTHARLEGPASSSGWSAALLTLFSASPSDYGGILRGAQPVLEEGDAVPPRRSSEQRISKSGRGAALLKCIQRTDSGLVGNESLGAARSLHAQGQKVSWRVPSLTTAGRSGVQLNPLTRRT